MLGLAFGVIVVRRRTVAIALLAAQSLALGVLAVDLADARSGYLVAAVLLSKAVVLPPLLYVLIRRTPEAAPGHGAHGSAGAPGGRGRGRALRCAS